MSYYSSLIRSILNRVGIDIHRYRPGFRNVAEAGALNSSGSMAAALQRSKERGTEISTIVDVGAAQGHWSHLVRHVFNERHHLLIEPLDERYIQLQGLQRQWAHTHVVNAAAGPSQGTMEFYVTKDLDGSGVADNGTHAKRRQVSVTTVDAEIHRLNLPAPYMIKLDTHGFEVPILDGAVETLKYTELLVIECYGFRIAPQALLFWEMCDYLQCKGFRLIDIVDLTWRPHDQAFWQCDAFFVPLQHGSFKSNTYFVGAFQA